MQSFALMIAYKPHCHKIFCDNILIVPVYFAIVCSSVCPLFLSHLIGECNSLYFGAHFNAQTVVRFCNTRAVRRRKHCKPVLTRFKTRCLWGLKFFWSNYRGTAHHKGILKKPLRSGTMAHWPMNLEGRSPSGPNHPDVTVQPLKLPGGWGSRGALTPLLFVL